MTPAVRWFRSAPLRLGTHDLPAFAENQLLLLANREKATCVEMAPRGELVVEPAVVITDLVRLGFHLLMHDETSHEYDLLHERAYIQLPPQQNLWASQSGSGSSPSA